MKASISSAASALSVAMFLSAYPSHAETPLMIVKRGPRSSNVQSMLLSERPANASHVYITGVSLFYEGQGSTFTAKWGDCMPGLRTIQPKALVAHFPLGLNFTPNLLRFYYSPSRGSGTTWASSHCN
jgi:hypothetical protein